MTTADAAKHSNLSKFTGQGTYLATAPVLSIIGIDGWTDLQIACVKVEANYVLISILIL
jgi:hypothetical protein